MRLRIYIKVDHPNRERTIKTIDGCVATLGDVLKRSSEAYWKIPTLMEEVWVFTSWAAPAQTQSTLMSFLGTGWESHDDHAHLSAIAGSTFFHDGIRDIFLDIEYIDRGREVGMLPQFTFGEEVVIASDRDALQKHNGQRATIKGHAFDHAGSQTWSYAIKIQGKSTLQMVEESDICSVT